MNNLNFEQIFIFILILCLLGMLAYFWWNREKSFKSLYLEFGKMRYLNGFNLGHLIVKVYFYLLFKKYKSKKDTYKYMIDELDEDVLESAWEIVEKFLGKTETNKDEVKIAHHAESNGGIRKAPKSEKPKATPMEPQYCQEQEI